MPVDIYGRDSALQPVRPCSVRLGSFIRIQRTRTSRRVSGCVGCVRDGHDGRSRRLRAVLQHQQSAEPDRTVTNPPATPRISIANPYVPALRRRSSVASATRSGRCNGTSRIRACTCTTSTFSRNCWQNIVVRPGTRVRAGLHLWRSADVNIAEPTRLADGTLFFPAGAPRTKHRVLHHRAEEQRRRLLVQRGDP